MLIEICFIKSLKKKVSFFVNESKEIEVNAKNILFNEAK